ncbi:pyruvate dehydrogenase complex dihydrolipoyllysine-residue acetyltransferase [Simiduia aestuariiviva]|uniref:Acetyltransferase component of pyruvate dehydrogenase complex n=1 Tax=Simiduia aestuariiviva TaxID=1510459 RepID=A0A839UJL3_9GAMM|nr:pyruvate dehydrogenase complex dihydrolipoyllysine-residue acetyltransferase [Simiduia aestuariiviva]MBB3167773.1 pyruvate dehydrogenase E2 component (dihydrolipoamide acetyltransferase) [Simiduia aestuariiviva]
MAIETIAVPDIGGSEDVEVIEVCVAVGDTIELEQSLVVLETDKASMEVPASVAGKITKLMVSEGDKVSEGSVLVEVESAAAATQAPAPKSPEPTAEPVQAAPKPNAQTASAGAEKTIEVPDIGGAEDVDVIEVCVTVGDEVSEGDSLIVLETDKASMEVPAPASGKIVSLAIKEGGKVSQGSVIGVMLTNDGEAVEAPVVSAAASEEAAPAETSAPAQQTAPAGDQNLVVPDIGGAEGVDVIEVCVSAGDSVSEGDSLIVLETDKASMEIPSAFTGTIKSLSVKDGDKVSAGDVIGVIAAEGDVAPTPAPVAAASAPSTSERAVSPGVQNQDVETAATKGFGDSVYAGPAVRKLARQLGVDMAKIKGSGPRNRLTKDDVRSYVKTIINDVQTGKMSAGAGSGIPQVPAVDFAKFGPVEMVKMSKIKKITAVNMQRSWLNVPHVTQWDDADITDLEAFRKSMKAEGEKRGIKLTPVPFLLKACAAALRAEPSFNVSMHHDGEHIVQKDYVHIGMAVDTPNGLMVPVIRDVDKKGLWELAEEATAMAKKARDGKLMPADMQGGCFTISSLGAMGGNGFTPIVNTPEVGILGVSRAQMKPVWNGSEFVPRNMLPLALSYDHRAINGADAGRFFTFLTGVIGDIRKLLL